MTPGMRTSEFLVTVLLVIGGILSGAENWVPNRYAWVGAVLSGVGYAISRGLAKAEPRPTPPVAPAPPGQAGAGQ